MNLKHVKLSIENFSNAGPMVAQEIVADHPYRDGKPVLEEVSGRKVTVVMLANHYEQLTVRVSDSTDTLSPLLARATPDNPVYVEFDNFTASIYSIRGNDGQVRTGISAKASAVRPVTYKHDEVIDI